MPKVTTSAKTKLQFKERGGKAQVDFRESLGICESEDAQFQKIKHGVRALGIKHFVLGLKPRDQEQHRKAAFFDEVYKVYPIFRQHKGAHVHLVRYVDQFLQSKAVPSSPYYKRTHSDIVLDDESDYNGSESTFYSPGSSYDEEISEPKSKPQEINDDEPDPFDYPYADRQRGAVRKRVDAHPSNEPAAYHNMKIFKALFECPPTPGGRAETRSPSRDLSVAIPRAEQQPTLRDHLYSPNRAEATRQTSPDDSESVNVSPGPVKAFLRRARLGHLLSELVMLGIKNQTRSAS